jgi:hypothetical protein
VVRPAALAVPITNFVLCPCFLGYATVKGTFLLRIFLDFHGRVTYMVPASRYRYLKKTNTVA